ncbi:hypothetical protein LCGC14_2157840 [marine sediment metagenome]|uniref:Uncharacterized protein n=1 Tax=marine sediment metagenome TaxID=412755 RepID=A0A0F9GPQ0_9ZZZZ
MKDDEYNFSDDVSIDYSNLPASELNQSTRYWKYAKLHANAIAKRERLKVDIDILKSELDLKIRSNPSDFGFDGSLREASITAAIMTHDDYKEKIKEYYDLNDDVHTFAAAVDSMKQRGYSLSNVNDTLRHGIYSVPRTMIEQAEASKKAKDNMEQEHIQHLNRSTKEE